MKPCTALPVVTALVGTAAGFLAGRYGTGLTAPSPPLASKGTAPGLSGPGIQNVHPGGEKPVNRPTVLMIRFSDLARTASPESALAQALALKGLEREEALRAIMLAWIEMSGVAGQEKEQMIAEANQAGPPGVLLKLAEMLRMESLSPYRSAWMTAFRDSPLRSSMFPWLVGVGADGQPDRAAEICRDWLPWEEAIFLRKAGLIWSGYHPQKALDWCRAHPGSASDELRASAVGQLISRNPDFAPSFLAGSDSIVERKAAAGAYASDLAGQDTRKAVEWANSLPEGPEKDAAHEGIYNAAPRGVGAILDAGSEGLPVVRNVVPGGPLDRAGFKPGDVLAGVQAPGGNFEGFAGGSLESIVRKLRGEPGSSVEVVGVRPDPATGIWQEYRALVQREQILFSQNQPDMPGEAPNQPPP